MAMEPWFLYPPEANYRRLSGSSVGARSAASTYQVMSAAIAEDGHEQYTNALELAEANIGAVGEKIEQVGRDQFLYSEQLSLQASQAGAQLDAVANRADSTRARRVPMSIIENNKLWQKTAMEQMWWNPAAPAILASALTAYGAMWAVNATTGTVFDVGAARQAMPVQVKSPPMSVTYGTNLPKTVVGGTTSIDRADLNALLKQIARPEQASQVLTPSAPQTMSPAVQNALANSEAVAHQMIRPIDGLRGGGLGTGDTMPYVGANPTQSYPRGGIPELTTQTTHGALAPVADRADLAAFNPAAGGMRPGVAPGMSQGMSQGTSQGTSRGMTQGMGTGPRYGTGAGTKAAGMRMPGFNRSSLGSGAGSGAGAGSGSTSPISAARAGGGAGSLGGMRSGGALGGMRAGGTGTGAGAGAGSVGGRMGPAFTGVNPMDKTLGSIQQAGSTGTTAGSGTGTVGQQARGGVGPMGMGRGNQQQREQSGSGARAYVAQEVSFTSLKDEEELARRRDDMFR